MPVVFSLLDLTGRFAPSLASVQACVVGARAIVVRGPYHRGLLLTALADADLTRGQAAWHARHLLCRLLGEPSLPAYLDAPFTTRGDVLRLLVRAARCFGVQHGGGWHVSRAGLHYYDLVPTRRAAAVAAGAIEVDRHTACLIRARIAAEVRP